MIHEHQIVIFAKSEKMNTTRYIYFFAKIANIGEKDKQSTYGLKIRIFISWIYIWGKRFLTIMIFANGNAKRLNAGKYNQNVHAFHQKWYRDKNHQQNICPRIEKSILLERVQVGRNRRHDSSVGFRLSLVGCFWNWDFWRFVLRYLPSSFLVVT